LVHEVTHIFDRPLYVDICKAQNGFENLENMKSTRREKLAGHITEMRAYRQQSGAQGYFFGSISYSERPTLNGIPIENLSRTTLQESGRREDKAKLILSDFKFNRKQRNNFIEPWIIDWKRLTKDERRSKK
jgi:hypothetical protein